MDASLPRPVVIIGAPRSGTNMLRDLLCAGNGVATWPCDEINYIWRHGNIRFPSDAFTEEMAKRSIRNYIQKQFRWVSLHFRAHTVVEKTCANSLRVPFVDRILDAPKYIFIYRDGVDVVASAKHRRIAQLDIAYTLRKARFVPLADLPYHALKYTGNRLSRAISPQKSIKTWGPVLPELPFAHRAKSLAEACALQWKLCVDISLEALDNIPEERVLRIRYEDLVNAKREETVRAAEFIGISPAELLASEKFHRISASSVGKGYAELSSDELASVLALIRPTMDRLGYER